MRNLLLPTRNIKVLGAQVVSSPLKSGDANKPPPTSTSNMFDARWTIRDHGPFSIAVSRRVILTNLRALDNNMLRACLYLLGRREGSLVIRSHIT